VLLVVGVENAELLERRLVSPLAHVKGRTLEQRRHATGGGKVKISGVEGHGVSEIIDGEERGVDKGSLHAGVA